MQRYCHFESLVASLHKQPESHRHGGSDSATKQIHSYHASAVFADIDFNAPFMNLAHQVVQYKSGTQKKNVSMLFHSWYLQYANDTDQQFHLHFPLCHVATNRQHNTKHHWS